MKKNRKGFWRNEEKNCQKQQQKGLVKSEANGGRILPSYGPSSSIHVLYSVSGI